MIRHKLSTQHSLQCYEFQFCINTLCLILICFSINKKKSGMKSFVCYKSMRWRQRWQWKRRRTNEKFDWNSIKIFSFFAIHFHLLLFDFLLLVNTNLSLFFHNFNTRDKKLKSSFFFCFELWSWWKTAGGSNDTGSVQFCMQKNAKKMCLLCRYARVQSKSGGRYWYEREKINNTQHKTRREEYILSSNSSSSSSI